MKKIYNYLIACSLTVAALTGCNPIKQSDLGSMRTPLPVPAPTIATIILGASDYANLPPANAASAQQFFHGSTDAFASIPTILTKEYPKAADKSQITVIYATSPVVPKVTLTDSLYADVAYTPTTDDYYSVTVKYTDFSTAQAISFLKLKYPSPTGNQLVVLNYTYYESGVTSSAGVANTIHSYLYTGGTWNKIYTISPAQYASIGRGNYNELVAADAPNLPGIFNNLLKNDAQIMATAKVGIVTYVSFNYYASKDYQRVMPLTFDGNNWVASNSTATNLFTLSNGVWAGQLDNTVAYTLGTADYTKIGANTSLNASAAAISDLAAHGDFTLNGTSRWTDTQIANGIIGILQTNYTSPSANQKYLVTFKTYGGYTTETYTFIYDGSKFVYQPTPSNSAYQLTGDDYVAISADGTTGATSSAQTNLASYGDFSTSGATAWTQTQINGGIANVLKTRYTTATSGQTITATYAIYSGGNVVTSGTFKYDGSKWAAQ